VVTVLVADGDPTMRGVLVRRLEHEGFVVEESDRSPSLPDLARVHQPTLMICEVRPDTEDELDLLRRDSWVPVILLADDALGSDRPALLDLGADDVIAKPFSPREVVARARATMRRATGPPLALTLSHGDLHVDLRARAVTIGGAPVDLARREYDLLVFLLRHPGQVFTRNQLLRHVWSAEEGWQSTATVTEHVRRLRGRLGPAPDGGPRIETVRSVGYRFRA
jgi:DNA-binding response OmpR family regulator